MTPKTVSRPKSGVKKKKADKYANFKPTPDIFDSCYDEENKEHFPKSSLVEEKTCEPNYFDAIKKPHSEFVKDLAYMEKHNIDVDARKEFADDINDKLQKGARSPAAVTLIKALDKPYDEFIKDLKYLERKRLLSKEEKRAFADAIRKKKEEGLGPAAKTEVRKLLQSKSKKGKVFADLSKRDPSDQVGIARKVKAASILRNKNRRYEQRLADKAIDTNRRSRTCLLDDYDKKGNFIGGKKNFDWKESQRKLKQSLKESEPKPHYTKDEKKAFREAVLR